MSERENLLDKVRALMAKTVENGCTDGRLIAAAPDLLAACKMFTDGARDAVRALNAADIPCPASIALAAEKARAAIAKATGERP